MAKVQILIAGESATGKSMSLYNLAKNNPKSVAYISAEAGKNTPFVHGFTTATTPITSPYQVVEFFKIVEEMPEIEYCVLDGFNFLMNFFESQQSKGFEGWKEYGEFIRNFMQVTIAQSTKKWIIIAHNKKELTTDTGLYHYQVPIKGDVGQSGLEAFFNIVIYTVKFPLTQAKQMIEDGKIDPELFHISEDEEIEGVKYAYQVRSNAEMSKGRIRSYKDMWKKNQIYIDNDAELLMKHIEKVLKLN